MNPTDILASGLLAKREADAAEENQERQFTAEQFQQVVTALHESTKAMVGFLVKYQPDVTVKNIDKIKFPDKVSTPDVDKVVKAVKELGTTLKPGPDDDSGIIDAIKVLATQTKITNDLISKMDIKPRVEVPAPIVNVEKPDLKPILGAIEKNKPEPVDFKPVLDSLAANLKATKSLENTIMKLKFPSTNVPTDPLISYLSSDVDDSGTVQYFGYTDRFGGWYIQKYDKSVAPKTLRFSFGDGKALGTYAANWANRANLTYTIWGQ